jgi:polyribonucleotide nucleotidyltransferase
MDHDDYDGDVQVIEVISDDVGRIIGKGGAKIRSLEADTGCRIKVERNKGSDSIYTKVELDGSKESRDHLIEIISKFVTLKSNHHSI